MGHLTLSSTLHRAAVVAAGAAAALAATGSAHAATVLSAGWNSNCGAATCFNSQGTYAVTFSAASFKGPVDISKLLLARSVLGKLDGYFFSLSFMLNGKQVGSWGNWNMGSVAGDELSFTGADLAWNPDDGDLVLVLDLVAPNGEKLKPDGKGGWYLPASVGGGHAAPPEPDSTPDPVPDPPPLPDLDFGQGAGDGVVVFTDPPPQDSAPPQGDAPPMGAMDAMTSGAVPEPGVWMAMLTGFGLAGAALRRRRAALVRPALA